jgi:hypothetical protein
VLTLISPFLAASAAGDRSYEAFHVMREQLELTWRQPEPARVTHRACSIDKEDEAVLALQHVVDLIVNMSCILPAEWLSSCHRSAPWERRNARSVASGPNIATAASRHRVPAST